VKGADTTQQNYPDYKMYNKGHFSWGVRALMDTTKKVYVSYVGTGTFSVENDKIKEITTLSNIAGGISETILTISSKKEDEFTQVINQADGRVRYTIYTKVK
jgi:sorbitol-specific phosphotransferase system component IIBC